MEHCGVTYTEFWDMPIELRKWLVTRKNKHIEDKKNKNPRAPKPPPTKAPSKGRHAIP